ncbi:DUF2207 domain-containing protein [uncultured Roseibium sp.]|uniref:DUF2207 domain-containing protein n=1 Tax=uncultured Roseibium sp. TaxID=1936171 RepID=UPI00260715B6|nr:DUF2207 domain-containing protein [uncultured Roseibium sp.]
MNISRIAASALAALILLCLGWGAHADERILRYVSNIEVAQDGVLTVTETITVRSEAREIRRGIFRDLPLTAVGANGRSYRVGFKLLQVLQDGRPAPHFVRDSADGVRIYIGEENVFLQPGIYTYTIEYETDRQIRFIESYDQIYWNATGNEWNFPIDEAIARVVLPSGIRAIETTAYTGAFGSRDQFFEAGTEDDGNTVLFSTTQSLLAEEGFTIVVDMPAGSVARPTGAEELEYFLADFRLELIGGTGIVLVLFYYLWAWIKVGRDPAKGVIFPRFQPPANISPALAKYIENRGFGDGQWVALSAACLNLAVKKRLKLEDDDGDMTVSLLPEGRNGEAPGTGLPRGEAALEKWLSGRGSSLTLNEANGNSIQTLGSKFTGAIERESGGLYFKSNWTYLIPGVLLSLATFALLVFFGLLGSQQQEFVMLFLFFSVFATFFSAGLGALALGSLNFPLRLIFTLGFFALGMGIAATLANLITGALASMIAFPVSVAILVAINIVFFLIIDAPTTLGRKFLDEIEGLKLYLSVAEKERLNMSNMPDMSTVHFENLLPYAVALGVEKPWSKAFEGWLASAAGAAAAASYDPDWYSGRSFDARRVSDSVSATAGAMAGSFISSLPAPETSSSGSSSSGSSGGGGGGGGGGGW